MEREPTTPEQRRRLLEQCMAAMAAGDAAFMFTFLHEFGPQVERVVRSIVAEMGRRDVLADTDEVHGLVQDAVMVVFERSPGWRPDGASPRLWRGANGRRVGVVLRARDRARPASRGRSRRRTPRPAPDHGARAW